MTLNGVEAWSPPTGDIVQLVATGRFWDAVSVSFSIGLPVIKRLDNGAVIHDASGGRLLWLIRPGAADTWDLPEPSVQIFRDSTCVAVPPVGRTEGHHRLRWIVPLTRTCYLTDPELLRAALAAEIEAVYGPQLVLASCEACINATAFGGKHRCEGTSSMGVDGSRKLTELHSPAPCPCPCNRTDTEAES